MAITDEEYIDKYQPALSILTKYKIAKFIGKSGRHKMEPDYILITQNENFLKAQTLSVIKYIKEYISQTNPGRLIRTWEYISNNSLL